MAVSINDGSLQWTAGIDLNQVRKQIAEVQDLMMNATKQAEEQDRAIDRLARRAAAGVAAYISVQATSGFINQMIRVRGEFQQLEVAFRTMLGSKERADKLLAQVTEFAATTPYGLDEVAKATKQLLAFGIEAEDVQKTLRSLGDVAAGIGAPIGEIAYLYGTIKTQGTAFTQDIRQFAQRGIPVYEELAKVLQVNTEEVGNLISAGKVGFPEIQKVFESLTAEGSKFGGLMAEQSKTLAGQISNLQDSVTQMFNELGKGSEGAVSAAISGLATLVENYETVLDIIKLLIVAYGSYKAAIIVSNAVTAISTSLTKGYTAAELLRYHAMLLSDKAMKALNATLLKNPVALVVAGIASLVTAFVLFRKESAKVRTAQDYLADAQKEVASRMAETESKIRPYVEALRKANVSEQERVEIYNKLKAIDPEIVKGLDAKTLSYDALSKNVNAYVAALRQQFQVEANKSSIQKSLQDEQKIRDEINKLEESRQKQRERLEKNRANLTARNDGAAKAQLKNYQQYLNNINDLYKDEESQLKEQLSRQQQITEELAGTQINTEKTVQEAKRRTLEIIDEEIKAERERQTKFSATSKEYQEYQKKIEALEAERKKITGATDKDIRAGSKLENDRNSIIEKRIGLLERIADLERGAAQTGLTDKEKAIDAVNQKYDQQLESLQEVNREIDRFNKKNPRASVALLGQDEINRINAARQVELNNVSYKQDAENYIDSLKRKEQAFAELQKAQLSGNGLIIEKAIQTYEAELQGFESMIDFLKSEYDKLFDTLQFDGTDDIGTVTRFEAVQKMLTDAEKKADEDEKKRQLDKFSEMLDNLETFNQKRADINRKYNDLEATLNKNKGIFSPEEFEARKKALEEGRKDELNELENDAIRQSALYKKLNEDIIRFTRDQIKSRIKELKDLLKTSTNLTPEVKADIQAVIDQYEGLLDSTNDVVVEYQKLSESLAGVADIFSTLATDIEELDSEVAGLLRTMSALVGVASNAANAVAQFASGNIIAGIAATVSAIGGIFSIGKRNREARREAQREIAEFQKQVLAGEIDVNLLYRQRLVEQARINKLKLDGLQDEREQLKKNQAQNLEDYQRIFELLQKESFISGKSTRRNGKKVVDELSSLSGLNYEQLEKLFLEGRLTDSAKDLFQTLQKLKQEGLDIDKALADSRLELQQLLTGTTSDNIASSIIDGFKAGKRSAAEFADDFQGLMEQALLQSLSYRALEGPLENFFEQFASDAESGQRLDAGEIERLQAMYNSIINNASEQFNQLQDIAGINFGQSQTGSGNTLTGAIRGITEQQAELLSGQFGGLRITAAETLSVAKAKLDVLNRIEVNTFKLHAMLDLWRRIERDGIKVI